MLNASALVKRSPCVFIEAEAVIHSSPRLLYTGLGWIDSYSIIGQIHCGQSKECSFQIAF